MSKSQFNELYQDAIDYSESVFVKKYCLETKNETCREDVYRRFDNELKKILTPHFRGKIMDRIRNGKIIPAGSISFGLGNDDLNCSLSNCYFIPINHDSINGIYECRKEMCKTYKYRGGAGTDITILRHKGCPVNNSAKTSSGSVSFLPGFSEDARTIGQNGRRAAAISILDIRHPDTIDYIWCKSKPEMVFEPDFITGRYPDISAFNISLKINDDFMNAVQNDEEWTFYFPDTKFDKYDTEWNGDYDEWIKKGYPLIDHGSINARDLLMQISESAWISGDPGVLFIDTVRKWSMSSFDPKTTPRGVNPCLPSWAPVLTPNGYKRFSDVTNQVLIDHTTYACSDLIKTRDLDDVYEVELESGLRLYATHDHVVSTVFEDKKIKDLKFYDILQVDYSPAISFINIDDDEFRKGLKCQEVNIDLFNESLSFQIGYLGQVSSQNCNKYPIETLEQLQLVGNSIGYYYVLDRDNHTLTRYKNKNIKRYQQKIKSIRKLDKQYPVYDIQVPGKNYFVSSGVVVHNCGEQALADYENCLLSCIALHKYVNNPFKENAEFDIDGFLEDVRLGIYFLNAVSDINEDRHPLKNQRDKDKYGKRVGQEFTGLGDMWAMLGFKYGSVEACEFIDDILYFKAVAEIETSIEIAKDKGSAKSLSTKKARKKFIQQPYIQRILERMLKNKRTELEKRIMKYGLRNSALNTVGPTGTISLVTDNCSSGIEPIFRLSYVRKSRINEDQKIYHFPLLKYVGEEVLSLSDDEVKKKYNYVDSFDLNYRDRLRTQATVQKWTDSSISSTINLKNESTIEDIYNIYLEGWENNLKGITVFRDGSKMGIFDSGENKDEKSNTKEIINIEMINNHLNNVKQELSQTQRAYRYVKYWKTVKVYITVTVDKTGKPKELFANVPYEAGFDRFGEYRSEVLMEKKSYWDAICRTTSLLLQLNTPLERIIKQLDRSSSTMVELPSILNQVLKNFINHDDEKIEEIKTSKTGGEFCPVCGKEGMIYQGGCQVCVLCGDSNCG